MANGPESSVLAADRPPEAQGVGVACPRPYSLGSSPVQFLDQLQPSCPYCVLTELEIESFKHFAISFF